MPGGNLLDWIRSVELDVLQCCNAMHLARNHLQTCAAVQSRSLDRIGLSCRCNVGSQLQPVPGGDLWDRIRSGARDGSACFGVASGEAERADVKQLAAMPSRCDKNREGCGLQARLPVSTAACARRGRT